jgi:hypothetical protein
MATRSGSRKLPATNDDDPAARAEAVIGSEAGSARANPSARAATSVRAGAAKRGGRPKRVFINVLVRETTRAGLIRLKATDRRPSQGEVIDELVSAELARRAGRRG